MSTQSNRVVVITGASSGLGRALAELLASKGVKLFLLSRTIESMDLAFAAEKINCDVTDPVSIKEAFKKVAAKADKIDVLINCAGVGLVKPLEESSDDEIEKVIATNLTGNILASKEGYQRMITKGSGHIVNVASTSGIKARPYETIYCASKWGLRGFTESLRLAAVKHKVRVTGVYPGGMKTNFWSGNEPTDIETFMDPKDIAVQIVNLLESPTSIAPSELVIERGV